MNRTELSRNRCVVTIGAFLATAGMAAAVVARADSLGVQLREGEVHVTLPRMDLFRGAVLTRLKNGSAVAFDFHLSLWTGNKDIVRRRSFERFVVSYDLWEEKFAVTTLRKPRAAANGLSPRQVEQWCLEHISIPAPDLSRETRLGARLDVRAVDPGRDAELFTGDALSLTGLVELLSRPARKDENRWTFESAAIQIGQLGKQEPRP
ncbi:MAG: hypothetical protein R2762_04165 [Bryobacteraceae bacterium]